MRSFITELIQIVAKSDIMLGKPCILLVFPKFFQRYSNSDIFFSFLCEEWIQIPLKSGQHRPANETQFKWRFADGLMVAQH